MALLTVENKGSSRPPLHESAAGRDFVFPFAEFDP
jgi:hypothetical protein